MIRLYEDLLEPLQYDTAHPIVLNDKSYFVYSAKFRNDVTPRLSAEMLEMDAFLWMMVFPVGQLPGYPEGYAHPKHNNFSSAFVKSNGDILLSSPEGTSIAGHVELTECFWTMPGMQSYRQRQSSEC